MTDRQSYADVAIANGAALSGETDLRNHDLLAIELPAAWTAASITFQSCVRNDGASNAASLTETFQDVFDSAGAEVTITAVQGHYVVLTEAQMHALRGLGRTKVRSGTTGTPVNQGAARVLRLVLGQQLG